MRRIFASTCLLLIAACFDPLSAIGDGVLVCVYQTEPGPGPEGNCPGEFYCAEDGRCYRGQPPQEPQCGRPECQVRSLTAGEEHTCVVRRDGDVWCWGANNEHQLGDDGTDNSAQPVRVMNLNGAKEVAAGDAHTCARVGGGDVYCWGANDLNQLGPGDGSQTLRKVEGVSNVIQLAAGRNHTCAKVSSEPSGNNDTAHEVYCWGANEKGQLGKPSSKSSATPQQVVELHRMDGGGGMGGGGGGMGGGGVGGDMGQPDIYVEHIAAGGDSSCAEANGQLHCWGDNQFGQFGNGGITSPVSPVVVPYTVEAFSALALGAAHGCGFRHDHEQESSKLWCWGANDSGQLGTGNNTPSFDAVQLTLPTSCEQFSEPKTRALHTCITCFDAVYCWGDNQFGQLGDGTTDQRNGPTQSLFSGAALVAAGGTHTCVTFGDGYSLCAGRNDKGQLGDGSFTDSASPVNVLLIPVDD